VSSLAVAEAYATIVLGEKLLMRYANPTCGLAWVSVGGSGIGYHGCLECNLTNMRTVSGGDVGFWHQVTRDCVSGNPRVQLCYSAITFRGGNIVKHVKHVSKETHFAMVTVRYFKWRRATPVDPLSAREHNSRYHGNGGKEKMVQLKGPWSKREEWIEE